MLSPEAELLLLLTFVVLVVLIVYVVWLQINLWLTRQVLNRTAIVFPAQRPEPNETGRGCVGSFGFLLMVIVLLGILFAAYVAQSL